MIALGVTRQVCSAACPGVASVASRACSTEGGAHPPTRPSSTRCRTHSATLAPRPHPARHPNHSGAHHRHHDRRGRARGTQRGACRADQRCADSSGVILAMPRPAAAARFHTAIFGPQDHFLGRGMGVRRAALATGPIARTGATPAPPPNCLPPCPGRSQAPRPPVSAHTLAVRPGSVTIGGGEALQRWITVQQRDARAGCCRIEVASCTCECSDLHSLGPGGEAFRGSACEHR